MQQMILCSLYDMFSQDNKKNDDARAPEINIKDGRDVFCWKLVIGVVFMYVWDCSDLI